MRRVGWARVHSAAPMRVRLPRRWAEHNCTPACHRLPPPLTAASPAGSSSSLWVTESSCTRSWNLCVSQHTRTAGAWRRGGVEGAAGSAGGAGASRRAPQHTRTAVGPLGGRHAWIAWGAGREGWAGTRRIQQVMPRSGRAARQRCPPARPPSWAPGSPSAPGTRCAAAISATAAVPTRDSTAPLLSTEAAPRKTCGVGAGCGGCVRRGGVGAGGVGGACGEVAWVRATCWCGQCLLAAHPMPAPAPLPAPPPAPALLPGFGTPAGPHPPCPPP